MTIQYSYGRPRADLREALTEFNAGQNFVTTQVLPVLGVKLKSANIPVLRRESFKPVNTNMRDGDAFPRVGMYMEDANYTCEKRGLEAPLTQTEIETYGSDFEVEVATVGMIEQLLMIQQEIRTAALLFNTTTWTGSALYTDNSGTPWDNAATDIIAQVLAAKEKVRLNTGFVPDSMLIGAVTLVNLLKNTGIKNQFPGVAVITEAMMRAALASIFGLQNLYVGNAVYDSAKEGQTYVGADVWSDDYALVFKKNEGSPKSGGLGRTILWTSITPDNVTVDQYIEKQSESIIYRVKHYNQEKVFDPYFGHLMKIDA